MSNKTYILVGILLMGVMLSACGTAVAAQGDETSLRTLTVNGTGRAYLTPDIAYISVGVHTEGPDAAQAVTSNNVNSLKVADALEDFGIEPEDIRTTNFSIYPQQQYDQDGKLTGVIYVVDNTVFVTLRDLDQIGDVFNAVVEAGANNINSVQFDVEDKSEALSEARDDAVEDAQSQADELAKAAGVGLGPVQNISTFSSGIPYPIIGGKGGGAMAAEVSVPISPGQMIVTVEVHMIYEIQ
ncbi:MAG: SIMPL domain-containing protein [Anaerolineales bacterium]|nr:SIMPL domain-containing protein [Anaerolineales bacterium]